MKGSECESSGLSVRYLPHRAVGKTRWFGPGHCSKVCFSKNSSPFNHLQLLITHSTSTSAVIIRSVPSACHRTQNLVSHRADASAAAVVAVGIISIQYRSPTLHFESAWTTLVEAGGTMEGLRAPKYQLRMIILLMSCILVFE